MRGKGALRCIDKLSRVPCLYYAGLIFALGVRVILAHLAVLIQNYWSCGQEVLFFLCMF